MNDIQKFRQRMAERGYEYTMEEAETIWNLSNDLVKSIEKIHSIDINKLKSMTKKEKQKVCKVFECSMVELEMYIKIIEDFME